MSQIRSLTGAGAWGRALAVVSLATVALAVLPQAPAAAAHRNRGSHFSGRSFGSFRGSHFGFSLGGRNLRVHYGYGRYYGYRPYFGYASYGYSPYFGGLYAYPSPALGFYSPFINYSLSPIYNYSLPLRPSTVYVYPPPIVRYYQGGETERREAEPRRTTPAPRRTPHPYDDPVPSMPEKGSLDEALANIRASWQKEDADLLAAHMPVKSDVRLYHDGELRRELSAGEFLRLTREALKETRTISFRFTEVRRPAEDEAQATARHTYVREGGEERDAETVTLRYDLVRRDDVWTLRDVRVAPAE